MAGSDGMSGNEGAEEGGGAKGDEARGWEGVGVGIAGDATTETPQGTGAGNPWRPCGPSRKCTVICCWSAATYCWSIAEIGSLPPYGKLASSRHIPGMILHAAYAYHFLVDIGTTAHPLTLFSASKMAAPVSQSRVHLSSISDMNSVKQVTHSFPGIYATG